MKIRTGFVSNSSTTSYTCEICGRTEAERDLSLRDIDMAQCVNEHVFCVDEMVEDLPENEKIDCYEIPEKYCPICNFLEFSQSDLCNYLLKLTKIPREEAFQEVKKSNPRRKKLYNGEYIMYACMKANIKREDVLDEVKAHFKTYADFRKYCLSKEDA